MVNQSGACAYDMCALCRTIRATLLTVPIVRTIPFSVEFIMFQAEFPFNPLAVKLFEVDRDW